MKALVTGACGFAGSHLIEHLLKSGDSVVALAAIGESPKNLQEVIDDISPIDIDLRDYESCLSLIEAHKPDTLFHLAGIAFLPDAEADPANLFAVNLGSTANLAKGILIHSPKTKMVYISSAEVYGRVDPSIMPVTEEQSVQPGNMYAYSKAFAETLLLDYQKKEGLNLTICRPFTHIGPRQSPKFAASGFARQISRIEKLLAPPVLKVGNLSAKRDMVDVQDMVRAYRLAADIQGNSGPFNIGTSHAHTIQHILDILISLSDVEISVEVDPGRLRPSDVPIYAGSFNLFNSLTGWVPQIPLEDSLAGLLEFWRKIL